MTSNEFMILAFIWMGSVMLSWIKVMYDNYKLMKLYRKEVDPPYALGWFDLPGRDYPADNNPDFDKVVWKQFSRSMGVTFSKHNDNPILAAASKRVRRGMIITLIVAIGGFIFIGLMVWLNLATQA